MTRFVKTVAIICSLFALVGCFTPTGKIETSPIDENTSKLPEQSTTFIEAQVVRVIDGDTIEVKIDGNLSTVRYIGIDTPETVHPTKEDEPYGKEASVRNRELVEGRIVILEKDVSETDKYGRLLRYVYVGDVFVNAELVKQGYAQVTTYPPDVKYQGIFIQLQREAREAGRGLWGLESQTQTSKSTANAKPTPNGTISIHITRIFYDGLVPRAESDEYVEITNRGNEAVDIRGWVLKDISEGYPAFTFPSFILKPANSIRVYTNEVHQEYGSFSFGYEQAIWNNSDPDTAALFDANGREIFRKSY
ncbi:thermonuclease family protein [Chloroflexota bacterium]